MSHPHHSNTNSRAYFMHFDAETMLADTGETRNYLKTGYPRDNTQQRGVPTTVGIPD